MQPSITSDGKVTLQFTQPPKSPVIPPTTVPLCTSVLPRYPAPQVITLPNRTTMTTVGSGDFSKSLKNSAVADSKVPPTVVFQKGLIPDTGKTTEQVKFGPSQTQISFQVPLTWSSQGSKSLLDSSKTVSLVSVNQPEASARSLLHGNETAPVQSNVTNVTVPTMTLSSAAIARIAKRNSFMISNKPYTIVPSSSSSVVTQLVKTEKLNKGKVTMAEAQIMLPSGPAKISWPLQSQSSTSDSKHILITTPVVTKSGQPASGKTVVANKQVLVTTNEPSAKMTDDIVTASPKVLASNGNQVITQKVNVPMKANIIPAQKNWELVKQSSQLLPQKTTKSPVISIEKHGEAKSFELGKFQTNDIKVKTEIDGHSDIKMHVTNNDKFENKSNSDSVESGSLKNSNEVFEDMKDVKPIIEAFDRQENVSENERQNISRECNEGMECLQVKIENDETYTPMEVDIMVKEEAKEGEPYNEKKDDFNPVNAMTWTDGVGELPGSSLKV